jgi:hypothetical protein
VSVRRLGMAVAAGLVGMLALAPLATAAPARPAGVTDLDTPTPADSASPTTIDQTSPTPADSPTAGDPTTVTPTPQAPPPSTPVGTTVTPVAAPTSAGAPTPPGVLAVKVIADNAVLGPAYWTGNRAGSFVITVQNTGNVPARATLRYTMPAGVTDAGTGACGHGSCQLDPLAPGTSRSLRVAVTVSADAWRHAPLTGRVDFSASSPGTADASGTVTWSVVFPPGPPAAGITLQVADVALDNDVTVPGQLVIRLTNTGARPAAGLVDLVVPAGVTVAPLPADCQTQRQVDPTTTECGLGTIPAGTQRAITISLVVSDRARADAPLAGLVRAALTPSGQGTRTTQASYQILAPPAQTGVSAVGTTAPQAAAAIGPAGDRAGAQLVIFGSLVLLALVAVGLVLIWGRDVVGRRRPRSGGLPPPETTRSWRPVATFVPPDDHLLAALAPAQVPAPRKPGDAESDTAVPAGIEPPGRAPDETGGGID